MLTRIVALFGSLTETQLATLAKAGWVGQSTDHQAEAGLYPAAKAAGLQLVRRNAAWTTMDHPLSSEDIRMNRAGEPEKYNRNGGFVRDSLMIEASHAVIIGSGLVDSRIKLIQDEAKRLKRPVRLLAPEKPVIDYKAVKAELEALQL